MKRNCPPGTALTPIIFAPDGPHAGYPTKNGGEGHGTLEDLTSRMERLEKQMMGRSPAATELSLGRVSAAPSSTIRGLSVKNKGTRTRYFGQNAPRVMLNLVSDKP